MVCGGTLYGDVQKEKKSRLKHIDYAHYDTYRHPISIVAGSPLQKWYARKTLRVNSYHHQGIRDLAPRFQPMAYAEDGLIEGYYDPKENFVVGLQFHPERMLEEPAGNWRIWKAFGAPFIAHVAQTSVCGVPSDSPARPCEPRSNETPQTEVCATDGPGPI